MKKDTKKSKAVAKKKVTTPKKRGRPPKVKEQELLERLKPMDDLALRTMKKGITVGDFRYLNLFYQYRYGKPKESMDITTKGESFNAPLISFFDSDDED